MVPLLAPLPPPLLEVGGVLRLLLLLLVLEVESGPLEAWIG